MADDLSSPTHLTPEQMSEIATGEAMTTRAAEHLRGCASCRDDLADTARVVRALSEPATISDPPSGLWDRIQAELDVDRPDPISGETDRPSAPATTGDPEPPPPSQADEVRRRREGRRRPLAVAAAAGLVIGAAGTGLVLGVLDGSGGDDGTPPSAPPPVLVGEAALDPVTEDEIQGSAQMVTTADGSDELILSISELPDEGYFEVWLRDEDATRLISLGTVTGGTTTLPVPAGVDLELFPVVDVSQEQFDGDPTHSGDTVTAGPMTAAEDPSDDQE